MTKMVLLGMDDGGGCGLLQGPGLRMASSEFPVRLALVSGQWSLGILEPGLYLVPTNTHLSTDLQPSILYPYLLSSIYSLY